MKFLGTQDLDYMELILRLDEDQNPTHSHLLVNMTGFAKIILQKLKFNLSLELYL